MVSVGSFGIRREKGEIVSLDDTGLTFKYKRPPSSKRIQMHVALHRIIALHVSGTRCDVTFNSNVFELTKYEPVRDIKDSNLPGLSVGKNKVGESLYFSKDLANVYFISRKPRNKRGSTPKVEKVKKPKGKLVTSGAW